MTRLLMPLLSLILLVYPFLVYFGLRHYEPRYVGLILLLLLALRYWLARGSIAQRGHIRSWVWLTGVSASLCMLVLVFNHAALIRLNPVLISLVMLVAFTYTLWHPPSMIERFARILTPDLPDAAISYTRRVTQVWCGFFLFNALIALYTCFFASFEIWTLYNGLISYLLMGVLFAAEYAYRRWHLRERH